MILHPISTYVNNLFFTMMRIGHFIRFSKRRAMNMGRQVAEIWDSKAFYEGLGLADITIKSHYTEGDWFVPLLKELSRAHPIVAMEDESAIFINEDGKRAFGRMWLFDGGEIRGAYR